MAHSVAFKASLIRKMTGRGAVTATALANETGVSQGTLSRWKRDASSVLDVPVDDKPAPREVPGKRAQDWTPEEKFQTVMETSGLSEAELGVYVRRHGLHATQLDTWRAESHKGAVAAEWCRGEGQAQQRTARDSEARTRGAAQGQGARGDHRAAGAKKNQCVVRGRGRRHEPEERQMILELVSVRLALQERAWVRVARSSRSTCGPSNVGSNTGSRAARMAVEARRPCRRTSSARSSGRRSSSW